MITIADEECPFCASNNFGRYPGDHADRYCHTCTRTWDSFKWFETHERAPEVVRADKEWFSPQLNLGIDKIS